MIVSAIVAVAKNNVIGKNNNIPWYLPDDLKYFKAKTLNHHVIMGRKSYESIGHPLPKRTNIIVTRNPFFIASNCLVVHTVEEGLDIAQENGEEEVFILGGAEIYKLSLPYLDRIYLTQIDLEIEGDTFFPQLNMDEWELVSEDPRRASGNNEYDHNFKVFERKKS